MMYSVVLKENVEVEGFDLIEIYYDKKVADGIIALDIELFDTLKTYKNIDIKGLEKKIMTSEELEEALNQGFYIDSDFKYCLNLDNTACYDLEINYNNKYETSEENLPDAIVITK